MKIHELPGDPGRRQKRKRVGRGAGSGLGKIAGRGHKGAQARAGGPKAARAGRFEGGQTPLTRRLPKRGFTNPNRIEYQIINIGQLNVFENDATVDIASLKAAGLISSARKPVKLLSVGDLERKLIVNIERASAAAAAAVTAAGGSIEATIGKAKKAAPAEAPEAPADS